MTKLIESNSTIPTSKSQVFSTAMDNQPSVDIHVLQGERSMAVDNRTLGRFQLTDLPPSPRGIPQIEVTFDIDANGIISVTAKDKATDQQQNIKIESGSSLSEEEIERMKQDAMENEEADQKRKQEVDKLNMVDSTIFQTEKQMGEFGDKLTEEDRESLNEKIEVLKKDYEDKNFDQIDSSLDELNKTWAEISTRLYQETSSEPIQEEGEENDDPVDVDSTDVEYEEVKE